MEQFPQLMEDQGKWKMGHIHSHHNMSTFFSGTDTDELHENAVNYLYYLSLIVNFSGKYSAKIAVHTKEEDRYLVHKNETGDPVKTLIPGVERLMLIDCDIAKGNADVPQWFSDQYDEIESEATARAIAAQQAAYHRNNTYYNGTRGTHVAPGTRQVPMTQREIEFPNDVNPNNLSSSEVYALLGKWIALDATSEDALAIVMRRQEEQYKESPEVMEAFYGNMLIEQFDAIIEGSVEEPVPERVKVKLLEQFDAIINSGNFDAFECLSDINDAITSLQMGDIQAELESHTSF